MGILFLKQKGAFVFTGIARLSFTALIISFAMAFISTIWAVFINSFVHDDVSVGLISAFLTLVAFLSFFLIVPVIEKGNKGKILFYSLLLTFPTLLLFSIVKDIYFFIFLAVLLIVLSAFRITSFGVIVRDISKSKQISRNEGLVYTFMNIAWVIGPLIAGYFASRFGMTNVFLLSAGFILFGLFVFKATRIKDAHISKRRDVNFFANFKDFFRDKERTFCYFLGGGITIWHTLIYLFMPLLILREGFDSLFVGVFLFLVSVPLILLEYPFAKLAGKKGFKKIFIIGYLIIAVVSFICFFISDIYLLFFLFFVSGVGLAMLEPTTEAYFFDIAKGDDEYRFYGPYNTTIDFNGFAARILASVSLIFLPFKFLFILFGALMLLMFLLSFRVKEIVEARRRGNRRGN